MTTPPKPDDEVRMWELDNDQRRIHDAGFIHGYLLAWTIRQTEIDELNHEADRYYAEMCRRPAPPEP